MIQKGDKITFGGKPARVTNVREEFGVTHIEGFFMDKWVKPEIVEPSRMTWGFEACSFCWTVHFSDCSMTLETRLDNLGEHEVRCIDIAYHGFSLRSR